MTKIWVDDNRNPPQGFLWAKSVTEAIRIIQECEQDYFSKTGNKPSFKDILIDLDHDAGDFFKDGGDYIRVLDWLEATDRSYSIRLHTMNTVGRSNMLNIIRKNNWNLLW